MDTLLLEDFRCFAGRNEVPIRPLTLLVGENSTGKTSFLAAVRAAHRLRSQTTLDFNEEPFRLGSYGQIANYRGGRAGRAKSITVGQQFALDRQRGSRRGVRPTRRESRGSTEVRIEARLISVNAQPTISELKVSSGIHELILRLPDHNQPAVSFTAADQVLFERTEGWGAAWARFIRDLGADLGFILKRVSTEAETAEDSDMTDKDREHLDMFTDVMTYRRNTRLYAFAPIQTSPQRTYEPVKEIRDPEGSHIPMMLARLLANDSASGFRAQLEEFGMDSGLYSSLSVRKLGRQGSDPFQVEVKPARGGRARNLIDVGYGVSQAVPIIADCVSAGPNATLLIQQPEVHLHPSAQAAMGSFFGQLAASGRNGLIVETHSDYLLDRVLMDVRDEEIQERDVMILYFEQGRRGVAIHPIEVDASGRVIDVPAGYRSFFLEEQRRFFGID